MGEEAVLKALKKKDEGALGWFIDRYSAYVGTIIYNVIGNIMTTADMEEVASDVFLVLWSNADKVQPDKIKAYLGGVARNKAREKTRELGREIPLEDDILILSDNSPERTYEIREQGELVKNAVLSMEYPDRDIFLRHYYYYQPVAQISREMGINISTVKTHLRRGRTKLKKTLTEGGDDGGNKNLRPLGLYPR